MTSQALSAFATSGAAALVEFIEALTVVLAAGTIIKTRQRPRKSSAGYDLTRMFIGSEGTLGLVTEATLKVTTKPANTSVAVCSFASIRDAADCVFRVVGAGVVLAGGVYWLVWARLLPWLRGLHAREEEEGAVRVGEEAVCE